MSKVQNKKYQFYMGNKNLPNQKWEGEYTKDMIVAMKKSSRNILYFAENFFYIIDPDKGKIKIDLFPYQKKSLRMIRDNRFSIMLASRQIGKTTILTIFALWVAMFNDYQNIVIVANKESTAIEIFRRIRLAYEQMDNFIKSPVVEYGKTSCEFSNGSRIAISTTTGSAARGQSITCLLIDECAFIEPESILEDFWRSVFPTISRSKKSKVLIASTPNGTGNLFHKLCDGAVKKENGFVLQKVLWDVIPGRDEKWKKHQIKLIGSLEAFQQEFEAEFLNSGDSMIDTEQYMKMELVCDDPIDVFDDGNYKVWEEPDPMKVYVAGVDVSEGVGIDATCVQILDISDITDIKQVAVWHSRSTPPRTFTNKLFEVLQNWGNPLTLIERNGPGGQVVDRLTYDLGYEKIVSYGTHTTKNKFRLGFICNNAVKFTGVSNMRYFINEVSSVTFRDIHTLKELKTFVRSGQGKWAAIRGESDDRVMSLLYALFILESDVCEKHFEIVESDKFGKPLIIQAHEDGIPLFENATSLYTNQQVVGDGYSSVSPIVFGMEDRVGSDISDLELDGWELI